ncbi:substrate-binding periplasmic protein, partial [candidate division CSSED10-310 bacterium]
TQRREEYLLFPEEPLAIEINAFFALEKSVIHYSGDLNDLKSHKIGAIRGYSYGHTFDDSSLGREYALNEKMLLEKIQNHRCTIGIGNIIVIEKLAQKMNIGIKILKPSVSEDPLFIAFSKVKGHQKLTQEFSKALHELRRTGKYQQILEQYADVYISKK